MGGYGKPDEMKAVMHEWIGTGVRDIKLERQLKSDTICLFVDGREKKRYIGITRSEWDKIRESAEVSDGKWKIEGFICDSSVYGPGDYLIFAVLKSA